MFKKHLQQLPLYFLKLYKLKRCSRKECCEQCTHVKFKGTMSTWSVQNPPQKHVDHQDATDTQKKHTIFRVFQIFLFLFSSSFIISEMIFPRNNEFPHWFGFALISKQNIRTYCVVFNYLQCVSLTYWFAIKKRSSLCYMSHR